ncbi:MAG: glycosyltransferase family A protein [Terracidiphilus sp.]|jgi:glycosyltransferase involved in cell wall biosynthesis
MSISVVIPTYNGSHFIAETLESVFAQTIHPDEVLVIDDGSTDDTAAIAESFTPQVSVFRRSNQRQAAARNFGAQQATSEWIAFIDHDDLWEPNKLERQMDELARHPEADLCYTGLVLLMQQGETAIPGRVWDVPPAKDIRKALFSDVPFLPSSVIIRRSTMLAVNGFDPKVCHGSEDYDMWLRLLHSGAKFAACREPLFQYRRHKGNASRDMAWFDECMEIYKRLVLPHLPRFAGRIAHLKFQSGHEKNLANTLREQRNPAHLAVMARSVLHWPFNDPYRYEALIRMLYTRISIRIMKRASGGAA